MRHTSARAIHHRSLLTANAWRVSLCMPRVHILFRYGHKRVRDREDVAVVVRSERLVATLAHKQPCDGAGLHDLRIGCLLLTLYLDRYSVSAHTCIPSACTPGLDRVRFGAPIKTDDADCLGRVFALGLMPSYTSFPVLRLAHLVTV